ncbi:hypothetical protein [Chryseobacterium sp. SSA4.19]|nr:hypothetical protein [Chryseobacterium sp. SSA4.19]
MNIRINASGQQQKSSQKDDQGIFKGEGDYILNEFSHYGVELST